MKKSVLVYGACAALFVSVIGVNECLHVYHDHKIHEHAAFKTKVVSSRLLVNHSQTVETSTTGTTVDVIGLRKFPYPYDAMFAISSDADDETLRKFNLIHQFINTREMTPFGYYGLGLPFADSVFMYNGSNIKSPVDMDNTPRSEEMSWFKGVSSQPFEAQAINHYMQVGWIDTLHSYGDFSRTDPKQTLFRRSLAKQAISALEAHHDDMTVWTDHGNQSNVDGFGSRGVAKFYQYQQGSDPKSPYYHTDLTIPYGVRFVWPDSNSDIYGHSSIVYPLKLNDRRMVWGFSRYTSTGYTSAGAPIWAWTVGDLSKQITLQKLTLLEKAHDYCIIAQHLEALNEKLPLPQNAIDALWVLAKQYDEKKLLVATTSHLLNYNVVQQYVRYRVTYANGNAYVHIEDIDDPVDGIFKPTVNDLRGITFYTSNPARTVIEIGDVPVPKGDIVENPSDGISPSVGIRWYTWNTTDYSRDYSRT